MSKISPEKVKRYDFTLKPKNPNAFWRWLARLFARVGLRGIKCKTNYVNMEGLKPPFLVLGTHQSLYDLNLMLMSLHPHRVNYISTLDGFKDYTHFLMRRVGCIAKRKFTKDLNLIRNMKYVLHDMGNVLGMYPEAKFSFEGCTSSLPVALGKLTKYLKVPIVTVILNGCYVMKPQWNPVTKRISMVESVVTQVITQEEIASLSAEDIQAKIEQSMWHDDFKWQYDNNIIIDDKNRAKGLNKILYQCASCHTEHEMYSEGTILRCGYCGKKWEMTELGRLKAIEGETEFEHIPDWFNWEKENVRKEVESGKYYFKDRVRVRTLPSYKRYYEQGMGEIEHSLNGFKLKCNVYGQEKEIVWDGITTDGIHIEFDYKGKGDTLALSVPNDTYWMYVQTRRDAIMKVSIATEVIYKQKLGEARSSKIMNSDEILEQELTQGEGVE